MQLELYQIFNSHLFLFIIIFWVFYSIWITVTLDSIFQKYYKRLNCLIFENAWQQRINKFLSKLITKILKFIKLYELKTKISLFCKYTNIH